jgi:hypothetical protein
MASVLVGWMVSLLMELHLETSAIIRFRWAMTVSTLGPRQWIVVLSAYIRMSPLEQSGRSLTNIVNNLGPTREPVLP